MNEPPSILREIMDLKRQRLPALKERADHVRRAAHDRRARSRPRTLSAALELSERVSIVAEFKRASPSKGNIQTGADPRQTAAAYQTGGAAAISVLTEEDRFLGSVEDLQIIKEASALPVLRKDFIFDETQVYESAAIGADALLLIVAALDQRTLEQLRRLAEDELGVDALVEVHTADEMRRAADCGATLIGVNNRDLHSFKVSLDTSYALAEIAPPNAILISESGLERREQLLGLRAANYRGFLIGETLMRAGDSRATLRELIGGEGNW